MFPTRTPAVFLALLPAVLVATITACTGGDADTGDAAAGDTDTDTDTDGATGDDTVVYEIAYTEFLSGSPVADQEATVDGEPTTTDSEGTLVATGVPGASFTVAMNAEGFPPHVAYRTFPEWDGYGGATIPSESTMDLLSSTLGIPLDPEKVAIAVSVFTPSADGSSRDFLAGVTVDLDVAYDAALVLDSSAAAGLAGGNTTLEGSSSTVIFVNAAAGDVTPTFTTPDGQQCAEGAATFDAPAGAYVISGYTCE